MLAQPDLLEELLGRLIRAFGLHRAIEMPSGAALSMSELLAVGHLARSAPISQQDLAAFLRLDKSTVSRLLAGLERRGWLFRERSPANRRLRRVDLAPGARPVVEDMFERMRRRHQAILAELAPTEREALRTGLGALIRAVEQSREPADPRRAGDVAG